MAVEMVVRGVLGGGGLDVVFFGFGRRAVELNIVCFWSIGVYSWWL